MTRRPGRREYEGMHRDFRSLLRVWDPIGVFDDVDGGFAPDDEYDYLITDLYRRLERGEREDELTAHLTGDVVGLLGEPWRPEADRELAAGLVAWWDARGHRRLGQGPGVAA